MEDFNELISIEPEIEKQPQIGLVEKSKPQQLTLGVQDQIGKTLNSPESISDSGFLTVTKNLLTRYKQEGDTDFLDFSSIDPTAAAEKINQAYGFELTSNNVLSEVQQKICQNMVKLLQLLDAFQLNFGLELPFELGQNFDIQEIKAALSEHVRIKEFAYNSNEIDAAHSRWPNKPAGKQKKKSPKLRKSKKAKNIVAFPLPGFTESYNQLQIFYDYVALESLVHEVGFLSLMENYLTGSTISNAKKLLQVPTSDLELLFAKFTNLINPDIPGNAKDLEDLIFDFAERHIGSDWLEWKFSPITKSLKALQQHQSADEVKAIKSQLVVFMDFTRQQLKIEGISAMTSEIPKTWSPQKIDLFTSIYYGFDQIYDHILELNQFTADIPETNQLLQHLVEQCNYLLNFFVTETIAFDDPRHKILAEANAESVISKHFQFINAMTDTLDLLLERLDDSTTNSPEGLNVQRKIAAYMQLAFDADRFYQEKSVQNLYKSEAVQNTLMKLSVQSLEYLQQIVSEVVGKDRKNLNAIVSKQFLKTVAAMDNPEEFLKLMSDSVSVIDLESADLGTIFFLRDETLDFFSNLGESTQLICDLLQAVAPEQNPLLTEKNGLMVLKTNSQACRLLRKITTAQLQSLTTNCGPELYPEMLAALNGPSIATNYSRLVENLSYQGITTNQKQNYLQLMANPHKTAWAEVMLNSTQEDVVFWDQAFGYCGQYSLDLMARYQRNLPTEVAQLIDFDAEKFSLLFRTIAFFLAYEKHILPITDQIHLVESCSRQRGNLETDGILHQQLNTIGNLDFFQGAANLDEAIFRDLVLIIQGLNPESLQFISTENLIGQLADFCLYHPLETIREELETLNFCDDYQQQQQAFDNLINELSREEIEVYLEGAETTLTKFLGADGFVDYQNKISTLLAEGDTNIQYYSLFLNLIVNNRKLSVETEQALEQIREYLECDYFQMVKQAHDYWIEGRSIAAIIHFLENYELADDEFAEGMAEFGSELELEMAQLDEAAEATNVENNDLDILLAVDTVEKLHIHLTEKLSLEQLLTDKKVLFLTSTTASQWTHYRQLLNDFGGNLVDIKPLQKTVKSGLDWGNFDLVIYHAPTAGHKTRYLFDTQTKDLEKMAGTLFMHNSFSKSQLRIHLEKNAQRIQLFFENCPKS